MNGRKKKLKTLKVGNKKPSFYILDDQFKDFNNPETVKDLSNELKVWYKKQLGCCDSRWMLNTLKNLEIEEKEKVSIIEKRYEEVPDRLKL